MTLRQSGTKRFRVSIYPLIRPLAFALDAERAHRLTIAGPKLIPKLDPARVALVAPAANNGNGAGNGARTGSGRANGAANGNGNTNGPAASPDGQGGNASPDSVKTETPAATPRPTPRASQAGRPSGPGARGG